MVIKMSCKNCEHYDKDNEENIEVCLRYMEAIDYIDLDECELYESDLNEL